MFGEKLQIYYLLTLSLLRRVVGEKLTVHLRTLSLLLRAVAGKLSLVLEEKRESYTGEKIVMDMAPNERDRLKPQEEEEKDSVLDNLIDLLPFEMHVPGYKFCGPGTKLAERYNAVISVSIHWTSRVDSTILLLTTRAVIVAKSIEF